MITIANLLVVGTALVVAAGPAPDGLRQESGFLAPATIRDGGPTKPVHPAADDVSLQVAPVAASPVCEASIPQSSVRLRPAEPRTTTGPVRISVPAVRR